MIEWLTPEKINALAADPRHQGRADLAFDIDRRAPLLPEHYTMLYYTPVYASLHYEHRLRYNQLSGLRVNEFVMMFEADLVEQLLQPLSQHPRVVGAPELLRAIDTMIAEERSHYALFAAYNRAYRPDLYPAGKDRVFSATPAWTKAFFWTAGALASRLAFAMWYLMAMEESSIALPREMQRDPLTDAFGPIEKSFMAVHVEHMKDEARHVHIDGHLIDLVISGAPPWRRRLNARLFKSMLPACLRPTRGGSGVRVVRQLVRDMPELQDREEELVRAILSLKDNRAFQESLFNRRIMPMTFRLFDQTSELAGMDKHMVGYDRR